MTPAVTLQIPDERLLHRKPLTGSVVAVRES